MYGDALISLLWLSGPNLPIGGFAYSQGLAAAIDADRVHDEESLSRWMDGVLKHGLGGVDIPLLFRLYDAAQAGDEEGLCRWNEYILASRETAELMLEEIQLGKALHRLAKSQGLLPACTLPEEPGYVTMFACTAATMGVERRSAAQGFAWSWSENQAAVACKTIPLGQTSAQKVLLSMMEKINDAVEIAMGMADRDIGGSLPGLSMASSEHETQYSRLFRS